MNYRKKLYGKLLICALLLGFSTIGAYAQFIPVVFDRTYGDNIHYQHLSPTPTGDVVLTGVKNNKTNVTWVKRDGDILFSRPLTTDFISVNNTYYVGDNKLLIVGQASTNAKSKQAARVSGRAVVIDNTGNVLTDIYIGDEGSSLTHGQLLRDGGLMLAGYELQAGAIKAGMVGRTDRAGKIVYKYISQEGGPCVGFDVLGGSNEFVQAAFTGTNGMKASVVRLDGKGTPFFETNLPDSDFQVQKMVSDREGFIYLIGNSNSGGGRIFKLRTEGDIIFNKEIVPAAGGANLEYLYLSNNGNILVGGNGGDRCYYSLLRNDGTDLQKYIMKGRISGMGMNPVSGESVVVGFDADRERGTIIGLARDGRQTYQKVTDGNFDKTRLTPTGVFLASTSTGRICMVSNLGDLQFDRYAIEHTREAFDDVCFTPSGDILLMGMGNRVVKLGHGLYVSDVKINKPVNGFTTALFTVTLTGYSTTDQGVPVPVTVEYLTKEGTANEVNNYSPIKGSLSFVPSNDGAARYMIKQEVEVPIKANNLMEGRKLFELHLANVNQSYVVKPVGTGSIEDQEVVVKLVGTKEGLEGERDVVYELGIFKTNGEVLVNATGSDIIIDGVYGKGTADALDYDMGITPSLTIAKGAKTGKFHVKTLVDTRYELPKTVVVDFNKIHAINDANIGFESSLLSCLGTIVDQPAMLAIKSLGDHGRRNNIVSGFFRISLVRASDGELLTNSTGGDITVTSSLSQETTATEGKDFVLTNLHDLRIWGDGNRSAVNLNGIVLYDKDKLGSKKLSVGINSVSIPDNAPAVNIHPESNSDGFMIND